MGLFSRKSDDTKARIEELKKKIQAEQQAYAASAKEQPKASAQPAPPAQPSAEPAPVQAQPAPVAQPEPAPVQEVVVEHRAPVESVAPRVTLEEAPQRAAPERRSTFFDPPMAQTPSPQATQPRAREPLGEGSGVVLDLGEGMTLNVPVRTRMRLDEFLGVADKVRELQKLQARPGFR